MMVASLTSSSEVKLCLNKCSFKMGNRWKSLGAKSGLYVRWSNVSQSNFATGCKSAVLCVQWGTVMEEKITVSLRRLQKVCNSSDFYGGPVFQVGHQVELPQRCSCAHASTHMTMNTRSPLAYIWTACEISSSSAPQIIRIVNFFFDPPSYSCISQ